MKTSRKQGLLALAVCTTLLGCNPKQENAGQLPVIDVAGAYDNITEVNLSEYASSIEYIPLQTTNESMIPGNIIGMKLAPTDKGVVIFTSNSSNTPFHFSNTGKFISKIGTAGRAEKEFGSVFNAFPHNNFIDIADYQKIITYNLKDGSFVKSTPVNLGHSLSYRYPDGIYTYLETNFQTKQDNIFVIDSTGKEIASKLLGQYEPNKPTAKSLENTPPEGSGMFSFATIRNNTPLLCAGQNSPVIFINEKDTVYTVDKTAAISPKYLINYGEFRPGFYLNSIFFETDKFITSRALFNAKLYLVEDKYRFLYFVYDKQSGQTRGLEVDPATKSAGFTNDLDKGGITFYPITLKDSKMYQLVDAIKFMDYAEQSSSRKMKEVAAQLDEESNPVMVVVTLK